MAYGHNSDFLQLNFSQREGKAPLPEPMRLNHISKRFRHSIWRVIDKTFYRYESGKGIYGEFHGYCYSDKIAFEIIESYQFDVLLTTHDSIASLNDEQHRDIIRSVLIDQDYHNILTFLEFVLRHKKCPQFVQDVLTRTFDEIHIAYRVTEISGKLTILPRVTRETGEATQQAIETLQRLKMKGASTHLLRAADHINAQQYGGSVADSIHAVESVARTIDPEAAKTLGPALDSLQRRGYLKHGALKAGFLNLYGYTSNEQGIRHALLDRESPDVELDEAIFMFGACACFAAYLASKHEKAGTGHIQ